MLSLKKRARDSVTYRAGLVASSNWVESPVFPYNLFVSTALLFVLSRC